MLDNFQNMSKLELVTLGRKMGIPMGDYCRAHKPELLALFAGRTDEAVALMQGQSLISGAMAVAPSVNHKAFVAPRYDDICVVRSAPASEVFKVRSAALKNIMVDVWNDPSAPKAMEKFHWNAKHLAVALSSMNRQRPVWLGGPAGTGKTEFVKQLCARLGRGFSRVQFDASLEAYHVIGGERVKSASTVWQDGLVLAGFRRPGAVILLDEVGFARSEYTSSLHAAIEPDAIVTVPETGEVIERAKGVCFFAADNSNGRGDSTGVYVGIREQNNAFLNRFARFLNFEYLSVDEESVIVSDNTGCTPALANLVSSFISICRAKAEGGALESPPTMREAFYLAEALMDGIPSREAFECVIVNRAPIDCQEILQQLWAANVDADMVAAAAAGTAVVLKTKQVATPVAAVAKAA